MGFLSKVFGKKDEESAGVEKYTQLKQLLQNEDILMAVMVEDSTAPISIALEVGAANNLINYLSALTGLSEMDVISCGASTAEEQYKNHYDETIISMIIKKEGVDIKGLSNGDDKWVNVLIEWANDNDLEAFKNYSTVPAYPQTGFPREKNQLSSLESLYLPKSGISYLPPELGKLTKLQGICLDGNSIDEYPEEMCHYKYLMRLDIDGNNLETLPHEIGNLTSLQILSLESNKINDLPIEMTKLSNLRKLVLGKQPIHLGSRYSPLSKDGFKVINCFFDIIEEEPTEVWLKNTDTSGLTMTG